ncbi:MAG TPA: (2Fe-2S)-binding protein, partial [Variovorax sp.]|nr:(2Fe-2S)-binding protein [Variovorax sp.]
MSDDFAAELHQRATAAMQAGRADAQGQGSQVRVAQYADEAQAGREQRLLRQHPQPVAASSSLAAPGAWLSMTHMGVPLLLVRQEGGQVQAF